MRYRSGHAELYLDGQQFLSTSSVVRLITTQQGELRSAAGIASEKSSVELHHTGKPQQIFSIDSNSNIEFKFKL
jgi:hypothetical protein